ncbi:MAG: hypothetical protein ABL888_00825 [Pirellulaceae bacterium]
MVREIVNQGLVDIMLMSASTSEILALDEGLFATSPITPAARANDTTDIWCGQSGGYSREPSLPFRTATIDQLQCGRVECSPEERANGVDLGLYSITFNNDTRLDREALTAYREFRIEAEKKGFRHFLEVFAPNAPVNSVGDVGRYVNDCIARTLAGIPRRSRPIFLKIPYFGPVAMDELAAYDPSLVIGILGGSAGSTLETFTLLAEAKKYGARAALFGRRINQAEDQLAFIRHLRQIADGEISPEEAVASYHAELASAGITPHRSN